MLWPLTVVLVANTNGRLAIPALAGLLVSKTKQLRAIRCLLTTYRKLCKLNWTFQRTRYWIPTIQDG